MLRDMHDSLGRALAGMRVKAVLPLVRGQLLDIGCGSNQLVERYVHGVGIDVHPWSGVDLLVRNSAELPFESQSFDTITVLAALNHIPNRGDVLDECRRLLRPDGQVLVTMLTPTISRLWHRLRSTSDADLRERGMKAGEVYGFTRTEVIRLFDDHGFRLGSERRFMLAFNRIYVFHVRESDEAPSRRGL